MIEFIMDNNALQPKEGLSFTMKTRILIIIYGQTLLIELCRHHRIDSRSGVGLQSCLTAWASGIDSR